jgi:hypothetical protein
LLREWQELEERASTEGSGKISVKIHVSSEEGRLDVGAVLRQRLSSQAAEYHTHEQGKEAASIEPARSAWVYVSGPEGLLRKADDACVNLEHKVRAARRKRRSDGDNYIAVETLGHYVAKWEV